MTIRPLFNGLLIAVGFSLTLPVQAEITKYYFSGAVDTVAPSLSEYVSLGTLYSGWFELDDAISNSSSFPIRGQYVGALVAGSVSMGSITANVSGGAAQVQPPPAYNLFNTVAGAAYGLGGTVTVTGSPQGWSGLGWGFQLGSSTGSAFSSTSFPTISQITNLSLYDSKAFHLLLSDGTYSHSISSTLTSVVPIPEAESYALMALGIGLVGWLARRRR
jgi:hypothetical protein